MDKNPENNIILTQSEGLTMNPRPSNPKYARKYRGLQEETTHIEAVQRTVKKVMHQPKKEQVIHRKRDRDLER